MSNSSTWHTFKNAGLILLSLFFLPIDTIIALTAYLWTKLIPRTHHHAASHQSTASTSPPSSSSSSSLTQKTVLITGINMSKGLALARLFHRRGHRVIGADFHALCPGRVSSAIHAFRTLPDLVAAAAPHVSDAYVQRLVDIVRADGVHLWVSASDVHGAVADARAKEAVEDRTTARAVQFGVREVEVLHEKDSFMEHTRGVGLQVPETVVVNSRDDVVAFLKERACLDSANTDKKYLVKPIGVNDIARFSMALLPQSSPSQTLQRIDTIPFPTSSSPSAQTPYIIQEFIAGREYCTHALVIRGTVRAFVACPSSTVLMHYRPLPADAPLSRAMLRFTRRQAEAFQQQQQKQGGDGFTGHLSFDFLVREGEDEDEDKVWPIECNPRVHTAVVLFNDTPELVEEYLAALDPSPLHELPTEPLYPRGPRQYYWLGQDLVENVIYPLTLVAGRRLGLGFPLDTDQAPNLRKSVTDFVEHVLYWKDGTFETWDPWPWWWTYHVYWPVQFAGYLFRRRWSKINVSTGKAFSAG